MKRKNQQKAQECRIIIAKMTMRLPKLLASNKIDYQDASSLSLIQNRHCSDP